VAEVAGQLKRAERRRKSAEHEAAEAVVARERARARVEELSASASDES
jgi:F0F1-type ATP synthase membrane subunit b/b'